MANRFTDSFAQNGFQNRAAGGDMFSAFNECRSKPAQFLANRGINVPQEYQNSPEQMAKYLLTNMPAGQQNNIIQRVNMLKGMFGMR